MTGFCPVCGLSYCVSRDSAGDVLKYEIGCRHYFEIELKEEEGWDGDYEIKESGVQG